MRHPHLAHDAQPRARRFMGCAGYFEEPSV
jgi:hypothetical protein